MQPSKSAADDMSSSIVTVMLVVLSVKTLILMVAGLNLVLTDEVTVIDSCYATVQLICVVLLFFTLLLVLPMIESRVLK